MGRPGNKFSVQIRASTCVFFALLLLVLPLRWLIAAFFAASFHEFCHLAAVWLCGGSISHINIGPRGAVINADQLSPIKQLICTLAGPLGSLLLLFSARWFPRVAVCAVIQSAYNLLPLYPMDGGNALRCLFSMLLPVSGAQKVCTVIESCCKYAILLAALWLAFCIKSVIIPLFAAGMILLQTKKENLLAKGAFREYNIGSFNSEVTQND